MTISSEELQKATYAIQYGTSEEAEEALAKLMGLKEEGKLPPNSGVEKYLENLEMREKIHAQREDEVARNIAGDDPYDHFEDEPKTVDGVMIEYNATHRQRILRPAVKSYPSVMNNLHGIRAVGEFVQQMVEAEGGDPENDPMFDDPDVYLAAAKLVHEIETKADRIDAEHERSEAMQQYINARGRRFQSEE